MKALVLVVLVTASPAFAERVPLPLAPAQRSEPPELQRGTDRTCEQGQIRTQGRTIGRASVEVLHDCGTDSNTTLMLKIGNDWFRSLLATIRLEPANMTDVLHHLRLLDERLTVGTLADGTTAVMHWAEILDQGIRACHVDTCTEELVSSERIQHVQVCSLGSAPTCASVEIQCRAAGCVTPQLRRGVLVVQDVKNGRIEELVTPAPPITPAPVAPITPVASGGM